MSLDHLNFMLFEFELGGLIVCLGWGSWIGGDCYLQRHESEVAGCPTQYSSNNKELASKYSDWEIFVTSNYVYNLMQIMFTVIVNNVVNSIDTRARCSSASTSSPFLEA